jgi:DNA modification methylase
MMSAQSLPKESSKMVTGFRDSAFAKNRELPVHRWVPWIAGFSADFVDDCLEKYIPSSRRKEAWVLDPFAGVGTTLLQGYLHSLNVIGFEINPYAALASKAKLGAATVSTGEFDRYISSFERFMRAKCPDYGNCKGNPTARPPDGFKGRTELFSQMVENRILTTLDFIGRIGEPFIADLFRLALGSVMVSVSNYSYEPSLTRRSAVDKPPIEDAPVTSVVSSKLRLMRDDISWLQRRMVHNGGFPKSQVIPSSFFLARTAVRRREFVDLVITSPPYLNNYHYPRNTRPQLHWLGLASGSGYKGAHEEDSFGKFWQTVRTQPRVRLDFRFQRLEKVIAQIRERNVDKGSYGGGGWANYAATYFNDTHRFFQLLSSILRPNAIAVIVLGNSIIQGVEVKTDDFFGQIAERSGFRFEDNILIRKKRTGNSIIQSSVRVDKAGERVVLYESAIIIRKSGTSK